MTSNKNPSSALAVIAVFFGFFIMGFVDVVGIASNYIRNDFSLSATTANFIPMMVFIWFFIISIPSSILMGKIGRKNTVLLALVVTAISMIVPYFSYSYGVLLVAFALLGISNTILQVALNPLVASMFNKEKTASLLTMGQFIKAIASFLGPIIAGFAVSRFGDWRLIFVAFSITSWLSVLFLLPSKVEELGFGNTPATFSGALSNLKNKTVLICFLCIFLIVGFDVGMNVSIPQILMKNVGLPLEQAGYGASVYFAAKTAGAFIGAFLLLKIQPARYLVFSLLIALLACLLLINTKNEWAAYTLIFIASFACANVFSIIFSFALQAVPTRANEVSALMIMAVAGGAVIPFLQGIISDTLGFFAASALILLSLALILALSIKLRSHVQQ